MIDLDDSSIDKVEELTFILDQNKKQFHFKFNTSEQKDMWISDIKAQNTRH